MTPMDEKALKNDLFYLVAYLLTSARGLYDEPSDYGIFRLLDASGRLLEIMESHGLSDEFLSDLRVLLDEEREGDMDDERQRQNLDHMALRIAEELQNRLTDR